MQSTSGTAEAEQEQNAFMSPAMTRQRDAASLNTVTPSPLPPPTSI